MENADYLEQVKAMNSCLNTLYLRMAIIMSKVVKNFSTRN